MCKYLRILSNSAKFSAGRPLLPAYNCLVAIAFTSSIYRLGAVASLKFFGDWKYASNYSKLAYCRLGIVQQRLLWQSYRIIATRLVPKENLSKWVTENFNGSNALPVINHPFFIHCWTHKGMCIIHSVMAVSKSDNPQSFSRRTYITTHLKLFNKTSKDWQK